MDMTLHLMPARKLEGEPKLPLNVTFGFMEADDPSPFPCVEVTIGPDDYLVLASDVALLGEAAKHQLKGG